MGSGDESSDSDVGARFRADRFVPARDGSSIGDIYSIMDEARAQSNQSPDPNKGMK